MLDGNNAPVCQSSNTQVRALAATGAISGRGDQAERIYVGLAGVLDGAMTGAGHVLTALVTPSSVAGSTTWSDVTGSTVTNDPTDAEVFNRAQVGIAAITVDATDTTGKTVYVGIGGFGGQGLAPLAWPNVPALYGSTDAGSTLAESDERPAEHAGECGAGGSGRSGDSVCGDGCRCLCHHFGYTMRRRETELLERVWRRAAGGAGDDAERGGYEWGEVAACGDEGARRVAGRAGEHRR